MKIHNPPTRIQLHPATDCWMQGDRYGEIYFESENLITVRLDKSQWLRTLRRRDVLTLDGEEFPYVFARNLANTEEG